MEFKNARGQQKYYVSFGQYVRTSEVLEELELKITGGDPREGRNTA